MLQAYVPHLTAPLTGCCNSWDIRKCFRQIQQKSLYFIWPAQSLYLTKGLQQLSGGMLYLSKWDTRSLFLFLHKPAQTSLGSKHPVWSSSHWPQDVHLAPRTKKQAKGLQNTGPTLPSGFSKQEQGLFLIHTPGPPQLATQPAPLLLHKSWWQSERMIMSMMCLRLLNQHCCWWSHCKLGWFVQRMGLTINFFLIKNGMAKDKFGNRENVYPYNPATDFPYTL